MLDTAVSFKPVGANVAAQHLLAHAKSIAMSTSDPKRQLKIKTGVVKRLDKEKKSYEKETVQLEEKLAKMRSEGRDEYEIKKAVEVLEESRMMVPDCQRRLTAAVEELKALVQAHQELAETEEFKASQEQLEAVGPNE